jgi:hypothetical protein
MTDPNNVVVAMLRNNAAVTALVGSRIYSPRLPNAKEYRPDEVDGGHGAISLYVRGGTNGTEDPLVTPSFQVTTWHVSSKKARAVMSAVTNVLHCLDVQNVTTVDGVARVFTGIQQVYPQDVIDSDTGWDTVVSFFSLNIAL